MVESGIHFITNGTLYRKINTERKNGFTERQRWSQIKWVIKTTFAHLCTPLTRDKCLPLTAVSGESSGDKGRFCHAFNPYLWRASKVYLISIVKCLRFEPKEWQKAHFAWIPRSPRASSECGVIASLGSQALDIQARPKLEVSVKFNCGLDTV